MTLFAAKTKRQAEPAEPQTKPRRKLTRAERKQIEAAIARANRTGKKEQSAQDLSLIHISPCRWRWGAGGPACTHWICWWGFAAALACGWRCI